MICTGWLTSLASNARRIGAALSLAVALAGLPSPSPAEAPQPSSIESQSNAGPLGAVLSKRGGGQMVAENRDLEANVAAKKALDDGDGTPSQGEAIWRLPAGDVPPPLTSHCDRRPGRFQPQHTGPPIG